jgi:hypothetical protein
MMKNSLQMWNLLKLMNKDRYLPRLNSIDEVYDSQVNIVDEIEYYHKYKENVGAPKQHDEKSHLSKESDVMSAMNEDEGPLQGGEKIKSILNAQDNIQNDNNISGLQKSF